jgi:hypothetical protein
VSERTGRNKTFENVFLRKSIFLYSSKLDDVLLNLIHLDESCEKFHCDETNLTFLYEKARLSQKVKDTKKKSVVESYKASSKNDGFNPVTFLLAHKIPLDSMCGVFPMVFKDYRFTIHCLRMAWAFLLTLKMKKMSDFKFRQRSCIRDPKKAFKYKYLYDSQNKLTLILLISIAIFELRE